MRDRDRFGMALEAGKGDGSDLSFSLARQGIEKSVGGSKDAAKVGLSGYSRIILE